jgi:dienelactone hydrolase
MRNIPTRRNTHQFNATMQTGGKGAAMTGRVLVLAALMLAGCTVFGQELAPVATPAATAVPAALPPTNLPTALPTATALPATATPVPPTATPLPTATPAPPTATPDRWAEYEPYTIEGLRNRVYGAEGEIEIESMMERAPNFTRYLIAYHGDGLRLTGMMNRPNGDGPFPVVILAHGYYPLDVYQTGNGTKLAADYLANQGFLTLSPDFRSHAGSDRAPNLFRAGHVIDVLHLIPMAQRLSDAQPGKVLLWGHSNGGAIAAKVIEASDQIAGALIYAPASSNIGEDYQFRVERAASRGGVIDPLDWPVRPDEAPDLYARLSPLGSAQYVSAPVRIIWGSDDETVPRKWPQDLYDALKAAGKDVQMTVYPGQPHSFNAAGNAQYLPAMLQFYRAVLAQP